MTLNPFARTDPARLLELTDPPPPAEYWLLSEDSRVSSFGVPFWGSPVTPQQSIGLFASTDRQGYALIGQRDWTVFGPNPPAPPPWLGDGLVVQIEASSDGCWAMFKNGTVTDPSGTMFRPPGTDHYSDFTVTQNGVCWLSEAGEVTGAMQTPAPEARVAIKLLSIGPRLLTLFSDGAIQLHDGDEPDSSLVGKLVSPPTSATPTPTGDGAWIITATGAVYGWGAATHGGNLQNPRPDENVIALCAPAK